MNLNLIWDFTCRDTLAQSYVAQTSKEAGKAAELAEQRKLSHYEERSAQYIISPVATETLGSWGPRSIKFMKELGKRICDATGGKDFNKLSLPVTEHCFPERKHYQYQGLYAKPKNNA